MQEHLPFSLIILPPGKDGQGLNSVELRTFSEEEYHVFFKGYVSDPMMDTTSFVYNREQVSRSYAYNHGGFRENYVHYGIFYEGKPVGSFQLKRIDVKKKTCEFGLILQNESCKNKGIGTKAIAEGIRIAHEKYGVETIIGDTMGRNRRMIKVFEKLGFQMTERVPKAFELSDGTFEDRLVYQKNIAEGFK